MRFVRIFFLAIIFLVFALNINALYAQDRGAFGAGIIIGSPIGPNAKYWMNHNLAVDLGLGFEDDFIIYSDILWHDWSILPQPTKGKLTGYLGLGLRFQDKGHEDNEFGFRTVAGAAYWIATTPLEVYLELVPVFQVSPDTDTDMDAGIGLRYYFSGL